MKPSEQLQAVLLVKEASKAQAVAEALAGIGGMTALGAAASPVVIGTDRLINFATERDPEERARKKLKWRHALLFGSAVGAGAGISQALRQYRRSRA